MSLSLSGRLAYLSHVDIRSIPFFTQDTLLAIKAPYGSTLEVPDPDEGMPPGKRRYEIQLASKSNAPIDVFLIQELPSSAKLTGNEILDQRSLGGPFSDPASHPRGLAHESINSGLVVESFPVFSEQDYHHHHQHQQQQRQQRQDAISPGGLLRHFEFPSDPYNFELKHGEAVSDLYDGFDGMREDTSCGEGTFDSRGLLLDDLHEEGITDIPADLGNERPPPPQQFSVRPTIFCTPSLL